MPAPRQRHSAVLLRDNRVLAFGGEGGAVACCSSAELYDATLNTWQPTGSPTVARDKPGTVLLPSGQVLAVGGFGRESPGGLATQLALAELYTP